MHRKRFPKAYTNYLPSAGTNLLTLDHVPKHITLKEKKAQAKQALEEEAAQNPPAPSPPPPCQTHSKINLVTEADEFGLYRQYFTMPTHDPDDSKDLFDLCDSTTLESAETLDPPDPNFVASGLPPIDLSETWGPFENVSVFNLMNWQLTGSNMKSIGETNRLVHEALQSPSFDKSHFDGFEAGRNATRLDNWVPEETELGLAEASDWCESTVRIPVPCDGVECPEDEAPEFEIHGVYTREITDVIKNIFQEPGFSGFTPYSIHSMVETDDGR